MSAPKQKLWCEVCNGDHWRKDCPNRKAEHSFAPVSLLDPVSAYRRYDVSGRDVNDSPGLWAENDILAIPGHWLVWTEKQPWPTVCNPQILAMMIGEYGMMNAYKMVRLGEGSNDQAQPRGN